VPPTLNRILKAGLPAAAALAVLGYGLAEAADVFLSATKPHRQVEVIDGATVPADAPADPVPTALRRTLPVTMALWGFGLVAAFEGLRRLVKGPAVKPPIKRPAAADVDKLLADLMVRAEADKAGPEVATPAPPGGVSTARSDRP
jgi:hypothetical protein